MRLRDYIIKSLKTVEDRDMFMSAAYEEYMETHDIAVLFRAVEYIEKAEELYDN